LGVTMVLNIDLPFGIAKWRHHQQWQT